MGKLSVVLAFGLAVPATASAQDEAPAAPTGSTTSDQIGVSVALDVSYASPSSIYDEEGESADVPDGESTSAALISVSAGYDFTGLGIDGLSAGLDLPLVMRSESEKGATGQTAESSGQGLGDLSLFVGYMFPAVPDMLDVGAKLRFKAATGKDDFDELADDELPIGSGHNNLQLSALAEGSTRGIGYGLELGYLMQMAKTDEGFTYNPGDFFYANASVGYLVLDMIEPRLHAFYATSGNYAMGVDGGDQSEIDKTGRGWFGLALDVGVKINDMLRAHAGWGSRLDFQGLNLPYGYVLSGTRTSGGLAAVTLGVSAAL